MSQIRNATETSCRKARLAGRGRATTALAVVLALAAAGSSAPEARAHERGRARHGAGERIVVPHHGHPGYGHHRRAHHHRYPAHREVFVVPHHLDLHHTRHLHPYYWGRVWVPAHGHFHVIYRFPVFVESEVVYRPFAYCGPHLYARGHFVYHGSRLSVAFDF